MGDLCQNSGECQGGSCEYVSMAIPADSRCEKIEIVFEILFEIAGAKL